MAAPPRDHVPARTHPGGDGGPPEVTVHHPAARARARLPQELRYVHHGPKGCSIHSLLEKNLEPHPSSAPACIMKSLPLLQICPGRPLYPDWPWQLYSDHNVATT